MTTGILEAIQEEMVFGTSDEIKVRDLTWYDHPTFLGVSLKHLITAKNTDGKFSSHLVRVNSGCEIGKHIHEGKWELHEVIKGHGRCIIESKEVNYRAGVAAVIPPDIPHIVKAGEEDLYILAKFIPALV
ncbi:cupin domain-containing protein [Sporomusa malonica]|uniref:Cupin domain protein n=1 Tax=Sporomusa malonica TaxID=112901 RepID=A0A1W1ZLW5_9FIRM|nr:cupin domain-containing protein [Sporomusa malonica]SMC49212.1 Cupin domain protein [Sporomusa malonica]